MQQNRLIALITALALSACGGNDVSLSLSGPGININTQHYGSRSPNRPGFTPNPNNQNNNRATPPAANWRRLNGMVATTARTDGDNIQRYFPDTSGCRDCAAIPSADRSSPYYLNGGNGTYRDTTPGGGQILYRNLSYASFGSYHAPGDRYRHFHVLQPTPYAAVPTSGSAHYAGAVIYRDAEDGRIALDVDFASRAVGGSVSGLSAVGGQPLDISANLAGNSISGNLHYRERSQENLVPYSGGILDATLSGPRAEHIIGQFSLPAAKTVRQYPENTAVFGADKQ